MAGPSLQSGQRQRDPNLVATLSFYLILLAFFILLNALSKLEDDRTRMVLESVNAAFDGRVGAVESLRPNTAALGSLRDAAELVGDVRRLFQSTIPATSAEASADEPTMRLSLRAESLFRPGRPEFQPGRALLLRRLSEVLLSERNAGLTFELDLLHGVPEEGGAIVAEAGARSLEVRRMGRLIAQLEEFGLPREQLSIGIAPDHPGVVQFQVRVREVPAASQAEKGPS